MKEVLPKEFEKSLKVLINGLTPKNRVPMSIDALKGYLFGLAVVPIDYDPEDWVPPIFGGKMPTFDSLEQRDMVYDILYDALHKFITAFEKEKLYFPYNYNIEKPNLKYFNKVSEWCKGFYESIRFHPELWYMDGSVEIPEKDNIPSIDEIEYETYVLLDVMALQIIMDFDEHKDNCMRVMIYQHIKNNKTTNVKIDEKYLKKYLLEFFYKVYQTILFHGYTITNDLLTDDKSTTT